MPVPAPYIMPWLIRLGQRRLPQALWKGNPQQRAVALTFDDGPSRFTPPLLEMLREEQVRATFFVLGNRAEKYPEIIRDMHTLGHQIALHGYWHQKWTGLGRAGLLRDLRQCRQVIESILERQQDPALLGYCRPPYGKCSRQILQWLQSERLRAVLLSILPGEQLLPRGWRELPERTAARVLRELGPGTIIALHDGEFLNGSDGVYDGTHVVQAARRVIRQAHERGYHFITVEEMDHG